MNAYVRAEKQDKIMRELLNEQQLENYQQWAREHANTFGNKPINYIHSLYCKIALLVNLWVYT